MRYLSFKAEELCKDIDFISWVVSPTEESNQYWNSFVALNPDKIKEIQIATEYIKTFHFEEYSPSNKDIISLKERIWNDIEFPIRKVNRWKSSFYWAAASLLLMAALGLFFINQTHTSYKTAYGKIQKIDLSDGTTVTLNAHSSLKVMKDLGSLAVREVWLEGEAYFEVAKKKNAKFIVHTPEAQVEVLGTEFNVNTRRQQTKVILYEGKVKLYVANAQEVVMKPGDMATVGGKTNDIRLNDVQPEHYDLWRKSMVILNDKSVSELVDMLQDTYGITLQIENSDLLTKKLTGKLSIKSPDEFIENLAIILEAQMIRSEKGYIFK